MKISYGIACITGDKRVVIIKKRHSYAFVDWVSQINYESNLSRNLLDYMSVNEKNLLFKLDFTTIAEEVGLFNPRKAHQSSKYYSRQLAFTNAFLQDGGAKLHHWLNESLFLFKDNYEIPKGRKHKTERPLDAAVREFQEETNISRRDYTIIPIRPHVITFYDAGQKYQYVYYIAVATNLKLSISFKNKEQIKEVASIHQFNLEELKSFDKNLYKIYSIILKRLKNKKIKYPIQT